MTISEPLILPFTYIVCSDLNSWLDTDAFDTAEELAAAKAAAEEILASWKSGEATEEAFAALANEKSADGDGTTGGLYEDVFQGKMVDEIDTWLFDEPRTTGDCEIIETTYNGSVVAMF